MDIPRADGAGLWGCWMHTYRVVSIPFYRVFATAFQAQQSITPPFHPWTLLNGLME